jgi:hypothetical protein
MRMGQNLDEQASRIEKGGSMSRCQFQKACALPPTKRPRIQLTTALRPACGGTNSGHLKVLETYRFSTGAKRPRLRLRIEDGMTFTWPWEAEASFHRLAGYYIKEDICLDRIARGRPAIDEPR